MDTSSVDTSDVENRHEIDNNSDFTEFQGRRKRRKKLVSKEILPSKHNVIGKTTSSSQLNFSQAVVKNQEMMVVPTKQLTPKKNLIGKRLSTGEHNRGLMASRSLLKKTFFHVSTIERTFSADNIVSYVKDNFQVSVISCFEIIKKDENGDPVIRWTAKNGKSYDFPKAFRVCINGDDTAGFLNMEAWPEHVVIRCRKFNKGKDLGIKEAEKENSVKEADKLISDASVAAVVSNITDSSSWFSQTTEIPGETNIHPHGGLRIRTVQLWT